MQRDTQRMSSYPLPSYGGTPPILRGEHHAECSTLFVPSESEIVYISKVVLTELSNHTLPLSEVHPKSWTG